MRLAFHSNDIGSVSLHEYHGRHRSYYRVRMYGPSLEKGFARKSPVAARALYSRACSVLNEALWNSRQPLLPGIPWA